MKKAIVLFILIVCVILPGMGQLYEPVRPDSIDRKRLNRTIATGVGIYAAGLSFLSFVWYKDQERVPIHFYDDSKGYLQMDKWGHAYVAYWQSYAAYNALRRAGLDKRSALIWGGPMGFVFQAPIEVFDGLYDGWGFSWYDIGANAFGSALFSVQQALFDEQPVLMKFSYSPSIYPDYHHILGTTALENFVLDYNAHTYWLSINLKAVSGISAIPPWLNFAIGYSANGMIHEFDNPEFYKGEPFPHLERYRQIFFSLDMDLSRIPVRRPWLGRLLRVANMIKVPFSALELNRLDGAKIRPLYF